MKKRQLLKAGLYGAASISLAACSQTARLEKNKKQNVLLITVDDLNAWVVDPYRHPLAKTPHLDKLLSQSLSFTNAHCAAPVCASSRTAFMTGVAPHVSGVYTNAQSVKTAQRKGNAHVALPDISHLPDLYRQQGYHSLGAGKLYHRWVSDELDHSKHYDSFMPEMRVPKEIMHHGHGYGGEMFYPFPVDNPLVDKLGVTQGQSLVAGPIDRATNSFNGLMPDELIAEWSTNALHAQGQQPFFMGVGFVRPHVPFTAPKEYFDAIPLDNITLPEVDDMQDIPAYGRAMTMGLIPGGDHNAVKKLGERYWKSLIQGYLASITFVDDQLGKLMNSLDETGLSQSTWVVLLSDHGQNFGEKANWRKMCLWEESTRVPFVIRPPGGMTAPASCDAAVSLLDLYPTLCELSGLPAHGELFGNSLVPLIENPDMPWDKPVLISWHYQNFAVRTNRWRLIRYRDNTNELYDHQVDPFERHNLAAQPKYQKIVDELMTHIPQQVSLPYGSVEWNGDMLDEFIRNRKLN